MHRAHPSQTQVLSTVIQFTEYYLSGSSAGNVTGNVFRYVLFDMKIRY